MINVSNDFKKAIKNADREIHGYVDVKYQNNTYDLDVAELPSLASIVLSDGSGLLSDKKIMTKYVALEEEYTLLDGSFVVWNNNIVDDTGIITNKIFEQMTDTTIHITNESTTSGVKGVTIYFRENLPFSFNVSYTFTDESTEIDNVTNNSDMIYQHIFEEEKYISDIYIEILSVEYPKHRLKIACVDFNLGDLYEGDELVSFDVDEEIDILVESLPINTCSININNYPDENGGNKFDPINPKGIVKYLDNTVTIEPYIGVLSADGGIEYVPMGLFYLDDWSSNSNGTVTLNGKNLLYKMKYKDMIWNSGMFSDTVYTPTLKTMIEASADVQCSFPTYSMPLKNWTNLHTNLFDYLQYISPCLLYNNRPDIVGINEYRKIYVNRYNNLVIDDIPTNVVDSISRHELINDVEYITNNPIKSVQANYTTYSTSAATTSTTIVDTSYTLTQEETYMWFKVDKYIAYITSLTGTVTQGSASVTLIGNNMKLILVKITGTVGSVIRITCVAHVPNTTSQQSYNATFNDPNVLSGDTINLNFGQCEIPNFDSIEKPFFYLDKPYDVKAQTIGDPSLEVGDMIKIQTRYQDTNDGYKDIIITKQQFTYDGGLQCNLEGVGE